MIYFYWKLDIDEYLKLGKKVVYEINRYPEMIDVIGDFKIDISCKTFFEEPYFPILEFIRTLEKWNKEIDMLYMCIETESNPLISFIKGDKGWIIKSPWQQFVWTDIFTIEELTEAIDNLTKNVKEQLNNIEISKI